MTHTFTVYKTETCPHCHAAMRFIGALQEQRGDITVKTVDANKEPAKFRKVAQTVGRSTVPQIFLDGRYLGGWDGLARAAKKGRLDAYLAGKEWVEPEKKGLLARILRK